MSRRDLETSTTRTPSGLHAQHAHKLQKPRPGSRTMELAMEMISNASASSASISTSRSAVATRQTTANMTVEPRTSYISFQATSSASIRGEGSMALSRFSKTYVTIYDYFRRPVQRILKPITAIEQYWAIRATIAEARLHAYELHKQELAAITASHADSRSRDLAELNLRYERELARIRHMVWIILGVLGVLLALAMFLIVRFVTVPTPARRESVHFTIPILSPFASVIEHETSAVNVPLVALLLFFAGISLFVWLRCCGARR